MIWDLAGNVWEHVNKANTIDGNGFNAGQTSVAGSSSSAGWDNDGLYAAADMQKYGAATGIGTTQGMGNVIRADGVANNIFARGGRAGDGLNAGVFAILLHYTAGTKYNDMTFRCAR